MAARPCGERGPRSSPGAHCPESDRPRTVHSGSPVGHRTLKEKPVAEEERIALYLDFENLALGARDRGEKLDMSVIMDALSERGRVTTRPRSDSASMITD